MSLRQRLSLACVVGAASLALTLSPGCNPKRDPPQQTPTSATGYGATTGGFGGGFAVGSGSTTGAGPTVHVEHCSCIYASQHEAGCQACAADEKTSGCSAAWSACLADPDCAALATYCVEAAANDGATIDACLGAPGKVRELLEAYFDCLCGDLHCGEKCDDSDTCAVASSSSASSSSASSSSGSVSASSTDASSTAASSSASGTGGAMP